MGFNFNPTLNHSCQEIFQTTQKIWAACGNLGKKNSCCPKKFGYSGEFPTNGFQDA